MQVQMSQCHGYYMVMSSSGAQPQLSDREISVKMRNNAQVLLISHRERTCHKRDLDPGETDNNSTQPLKLDVN